MKDGSLEITLRRRGGYFSVNGGMKGTCIAKFVTTVSQLKIRYFSEETFKFFEMLYLLIVWQENCPLGHAK